MKKSNERVKPKPRDSKKPVKGSCPRGAIVNTSSLGLGGSSTGFRVLKVELVGCLDRVTILTSDVHRLFANIHRKLGRKREIQGNS